MLKTKNLVNYFFSLSASELLGRFISFYTSIYLAHTLLPEKFGVLGYSFAFVSYFIIVGEFGFNTTGVKLISTNISKASTIASEIFSTKLFISTILYITLIVIVFFLNKSFDIKLSIFIYGATILVEALSLDFVFHGLNKFSILSIKPIAFSFFNLILILFFIESATPIYFVFLFHLVSRSATNMLILFLFKKNYGALQFQINLKRIYYYLKESFPIMLATFMAVICGSVDLLMIDYYKGAYFVGIYSAAYKLLIVALLPYGIIFKIFMPSLSKISKNFDFINTYRQFFIILISVSLIVFIPTMLLANEIMNFVWGMDYVAGTSSLLILLANGVIVGMSTAFGNPLNLWGKQNYYAIALSIGASVNIALNYFLIPIYSINGAAFATLGSELTIFLLVLPMFNIKLKSFR